MSKTTDTSKESTSESERVERLEKQINDMHTKFHEFLNTNPQPTRWYFLGIDHDIDHVLTPGLNHKVAGASALAAKSAVLVILGRAAYKGIKAWMSGDAVGAVEAVTDTTSEIADLSQAA